MKATLTADGTLVVTPENDLEAYALKQWGIASFATLDENALAEFPKITVNCGEFKGGFISSTRPLTSRIDV